MRYLGHTDGVWDVACLVKESAHVNLVGAGVLPLPSFLSAKGA
jgi:hypothetical protein